MASNTHAWRHVFKPAGLLVPAGVAVPELPQDFTKQPHVSDIALHNTIAEEGAAPYMALQTDAAAAECRHAYCQSVARRIDLDTPATTETAAASDFVCIVLISGCVDPHDERPDARRVPWDSVVVVGDRTRQYPVALFATDLPRFTGIYPGAVVGIRGAVLKRDASTMRPRDVAVNEVIHPSIPRPAYGPGGAAPTGPGGVRIMVACGPYPAGGETLQSAVMKIYSIAQHRGAQMVVIAGPYITAPTPGKVQTEQVNRRNIENMVNEVVTQSGRTPDRKCRAVFMPALDDISCVPVMPQLPSVCFDEFDSAAVDVTASNPCEFTVAGALRIGVCNYDAIALLRGAQLDRGLPPDASIRQVCHSIARSGVYAPVVDGHERVSDIKHLDRLAFGAAAAKATGAPATVPTPPHVMVYPNRSFSSPLAQTIGGEGGPLFVSFANGSDKSVAVLELTIADVERAARGGCTHENGVSAGIIDLVLNEIA